MHQSLCGDFLNSKKILYPLMERFAPDVAGAEDFPPWSVEIHPTARCNHRCIHCSYEERNESRRQLDISVMTRLISSLIALRVRGVFFSGGGEPCVYPGLARHIEELADNGVETALISNGALFEETGILDIAHRLNYTAISVPSCREDTFRRITGSDGLERVLAIPEKISARHGKQRPVVGARVVVTSLVVGEVPDILGALRQRGYDYALFKAVRDYEDRGLGLSETESAELARVIGELRAAGKLDPGFTNLDGVFNYRAPYAPTGRCHVNAMGMLAAVTPEGDVYHNISEIGDPAFLIGNLNDDTLERLWNGERRRQVKEHSHVQWGGGKCGNCRAIAYNGVIENVVGGAPATPDPFV